ncbi:D-allose transporter subunit [Anatilimnocola aggregata]|uniref:D-allose transporter subunit n=1 Tax=Anatilimnocola aggregata TaxID=2528021 RepID=A0A517YHM1_9BACT|nr:substrate-binding domain-containing protein [Anatilimnocola aggregata]QDU29718.1 D-allose transporter subunit [Anatilimnocola aggregata]
MLCKMLRPGFALVAASLLLIAGCTEAGKQPGGDPGTPSTGSSGKRIVFLINTPDPFWDAARAGFFAGEKAWKLPEAGMSVTFESNDGTPQGQIDKLRQFASQSDIVGVAISPIQADNAAIVEEMKNLQAAGVKVITVDNDVNRDRFRDARAFYIGTNNLDAGKAMGAATKAILAARNQEKGAYIQFVGDTGSDNGRARMDGVKQGLGTSFEDRDRMADGGDKGKAQENVRNALTNHNDIVALIGIWAYNGPAIATVVSERQAREQVAVVTFDAAEGSIEAMRQGNLDALCVQDPYDMAKQAVRLLKAMYEKDEAVIKEMYPNQGQPDGDILTTKIRIVAPETNSPLKEEMFDKNAVEFMTLPTLRQWLKDNNLKSS